MRGKAKGSGIVFFRYSSTGFPLTRVCWQRWAHLRPQVGIGLGFCFADRRHGVVLLDEGLEVGIGAVERGLFRLLQPADFAKVPV